VLASLGAVDEIGRMTVRIVSLLASATEIVCARRPVIGAVLAEALPALAVA
jgi:hypothetical protein